MRMMKNTIILLLLAAVVLTLGSCGNKTKSYPFDDGDSIDVVNADPTIYGISGEGTSMNTLQMITDTGDTLTFDLSELIERHLVLGGLQAGDRMAVVYEEDQKDVKKVINQSALLGNWVMPNPLDGSDEVGVRIKEGGIAESIEQTVVDYRTWRLNRGQLELVLVREDGSGDEEVGLYDIVSLTPDSLIFSDKEDVYRYHRQRPKEEYGKEIQLEESSVDDYKM